MRSGPKVQKCENLVDLVKSFQRTRAVYEGPDPSRPQYIINYEKSACWVQGKQAQAIDIRIRAARRQ